MSECLCVFQEILSKKHTSPGVLYNSHWATFEATKRLPQHSALISKQNFVAFVMCCWGYCQFMLGLGLDIHLFPALVMWMCNQCDIYFAKHFDISSVSSESEPPVAVSLSISLTVSSQRRALLLTVQNRRAPKEGKEENGDCHWEGVMAGRKRKTSELSERSKVCSLFSLSLCQNARVSQLLCLSLWLCSPQMSNWARQHW